MHGGYVSTLEERIAVTVAHAYQLVAWLPFQITEITTDPVDERIGYVRVRYNDGQEYASILTMVWPTPALIADASLRAFISEMECGNPALSRAWLLRSDRCRLRQMKRPKLHASGSWSA
jgi:hypothetical protein